MRIIINILLLILAIGCKTIELPTVEQSEKFIQQYKANIERAEKAIISQEHTFPKGNDFIIQMNQSLFNKIFSKFSEDRINDIYIFFDKTPDLISENKNVLGINYKNFINIDSGIVILDIKKFNFKALKENSIESEIMIFGKGNISISGSHTGIKARATPDIELTLDESIAFDMITDLKNQLILKPKPKNINLNAKFSINLLSWKIPYSYNFQLKTAEIIKPIIMPLVFNTDIELPPLTNQKNKSAEPYNIILSNAKLSSFSNKLEYRADLNLKKK